MEISTKTAKDIQSLTVFAKISSNKSGGVPNICYKMAVSKKLKINSARLLEG